MAPRCKVATVRAKNKNVFTCTSVMRVSVKTDSLPDIPNISQKGTRLGNWLTREQAKELLAVPDRSTLKGKRDYVILALLVGCALRGNELAELDVATIQQREGRWLLADLEGKGRRIRTVAIPIWVKAGHRRLEDRGRDRGRPA